VLSSSDLEPGLNPDCSEEEDDIEVHITSEMPYEKKIVVTSLKSLFFFPTSMGSLMPKSMK
jgi:hypothetical protein